jgi:hypothetical protein
MSMMSAPASANAIAMACPIPRVPPVTTAVLPTSENSFSNDSILLSLWERIVGKQLLSMSAMIGVYFAVWKSIGSFR